MASTIGTPEREGVDDGKERRSRRQLVRRTAEGAGLLALAGTGAFGFRQAIAKDDDDDDDSSGHGGSGDDNSGHGSGGDDHDNSGRGGGGDDDDPVITGEIPAGSIEVWITDDDADGFEPGNLTVDLGQSITFVNADDDPHTATGSGFDTGIMQPGQTATVTLDRPGIFAYACQIHPVMTGRIAVRDENGQVPSPTRSASPDDATPCRIVDFAFDPPLLTVPVGTTVAWTNADTVPHTATAVDGAFDSGIVDPGGGFAWEFTKPGTFAYVCGLHPQMRGTVEVTGDAPAAQGSPAATPGADASAPEATPTATAASQNGVLVGILDFSFEPATLEIPAGTAVTWHNGGAAPHTATAEDGSFDTGRLDPGREGSFIFDHPGTFGYVCAFHPQMAGTIVVT